MEKSKEKDTEKDTSKNAEKITKKNKGKDAEKSTNKNTEGKTENVTEKDTEKNTENNTENSIEKDPETGPEKSPEKCPEKSIEKRTEKIADIFTKKSNNIRMEKGKPPKKITIFERCAYRNCKNVKSENCKLFRFPQYGTKRFDIWIQNSGNTRLRAWTPTSVQKAGLCPDHFLDKDFILYKHRKKLHLGRNPIPYKTESTTDSSEDEKLDPIIEEITVEELPMDEDATFNSKELITTTAGTESRLYMDIIKSIVEKEHNIVPKNSFKRTEINKRTSEKEHNWAPTKSHQNITKENVPNNVVNTYKGKTTSKSIQVTIDEERHCNVTDRSCMTELSFDRKMCDSATQTTLFEKTTSTTTLSTHVPDEQVTRVTVMTQTGESEENLPSSLAPDFVVKDEVLSSVVLQSIEELNLQNSESQNQLDCQSAINAGTINTIPIESTDVGTINDNPVEDIVAETIQIQQSNLKTEADQTMADVQTDVVEEKQSDPVVVDKIYYPPLNDESDMAQVIEEFTPNLMAAHFYYASRAELLKEVMSACKAASNDGYPTKRVILPSKAEINDALKMSTFEELYTKRIANGMVGPRIVSVENMPSRTSATHTNHATSHGLLNSSDKNFTQLNWFNNEDILPLFNTHIEFEDDPVLKSNLSKVPPNHKKLHIQIEKLKKRNLKLKQIAQKWRRRQKRIRDILKHYKMKNDSRKHICNHSVLEFLAGKKCDKPLAKTVIGLQLHKDLTEYSTDEKNFAVRLFCYSPRAYSWMRGAGLNLPSETFMKQWVLQSQFPPALKLSLQFVDESLPLMESR